MSASCLAPGMLNPVRLKLLCPQACRPECPLPCPGRPCSSLALGGRWRSLSLACSPEGPLAPERAVCRRSGKCFCRAPSGCSQGCLFVKCQISFWRAGWSWRWPCAWTPRSTARRPKHPAAGQRAQINRRRESYRLEKEEINAECQKRGSTQGFKIMPGNVWWNVRQDASCCSKKTDDYFPRWMFSAASQVRNEKSY